MFYLKLVKYARTLKLNIEHAFNIYVVQLNMCTKNVFIYVHINDKTL